MKWFIGNGEFDEVLLLLNLDNFYSKVLRITRGCLPMNEIQKSLKNISNQSYIYYLSSWNLPIFTRLFLRQLNVVLVGIPNSIFFYSELYIRETNIRRYVGNTPNLTPSSVARILKRFPRTDMRTGEQTEDLSSLAWKISIE